MAVKGVRMKEKVKGNGDIEVGAMHDMSHNVQFILFHRISRLYKEDARKARGENEMRSESRVYTGSEECAQ